VIARSDDQDLGLPRRGSQNQRPAPASGGPSRKGRWLVAMQQTCLDNRLEWAGEPEQRYTERLLLLALLREEQPEWWSQADLERELPDVMPEDINAAIEDRGSRIPRSGACGERPHHSLAQHPPPGGARRDLHIELGPCEIALRGGASAAPQGLQHRAMITGHGARGISLTVSSAFGFSLRGNLASPPPHKNKQIGSAHPHGLVAACW
jgi:hypothetical protein